MTVASLLAALAACQPMDRTDLGPDLERELADGRDYAAALVSEGRRAVEPDVELAIALGYLERLRLGLGSPFRLIDHALQDPRLPEPTRRRLAWAFLARTLAGQAYEVDPVALDRAGTARAPSLPGAGRHHLELIEGAVSESPDPRGGELAVRLAYALAAAEGSVSRRANGLAAQAAALIRDREVARADALRVLREADQTGADPLALIPIWRAERRFNVEAPVKVALPWQVEREAVELAPRLANAIRLLGPRLGAAPTPTPARPPLLSEPVARRLAAVTASFMPPPHASVAVAMLVYRRELLEQVGLTDEQQQARAAFADRVRHEEALAAHHALLWHGEGGYNAAPSLATLWAAVALRAYAQQEVWFPGWGGPSARELEDRFGLAAVRFDDEVPAAWRPYYRRTLETALSDMHRVLPALDLRGLRVRFGEPPSRTATLALHEPRSRTIFFRPATMAGTIAHEVAHDLDWQVALRRYRVRGDYATDRATRFQQDRLALSLRGLSTAALVAPTPGDPDPPVHARRPAEVFARSVDWFVVMSLAREGRINAYLSSVQDDVLTGYGTVTPPDVSGRAGAALIDILDEVAPVYSSHRRWFLDQYGPGRALTPYDLVRRVLEAPLPESVTLGAGWTAATRGVRPSPRGLEEEEPAVMYADEEPEDDGVPFMAMDIGRQFAAIEAARNAAHEAIDAWICRAPGAASDPGLESARRRLVARAAAARARGVALEFAFEIGGERARRWLGRQFYGAPWPSAEVDRRTARLLQALVDEVRHLDRAEIGRATSAFRPAPQPQVCVAPSWAVAATAGR